MAGQGAEIWIKLWFVVHLRSSLRLNFGILAKFWFEGANMWCFHFWGKFKSRSNFFLKNFNCQQFENLEFFGSIVRSTKLVEYIPLWSCSPHTNVKIKCKQFSRKVFFIENLIKFSFSYNNCVLNYSKL